MNPADLLGIRLIWSVAAVGELVCTFSMILTADGNPVVSAMFLAAAITWGLVLLALSLVVPVEAISPRSHLEETPDS